MNELSKTEVESPSKTVSHVIVLASPKEAEDIVGRLSDNGFRLGDDATEKNLGIRSRMLPIADGGFIEVACELSPGSFAHGDAFTITPRIVSISYTTDHAAADVARWSEQDDQVPIVRQAGSWQRKDGTFGYYIGVLPAPISTDVFFGLRDVGLFPLPYAGLADGEPGLQRVTVRGRNAQEWRQRHIDYFDLLDQGGSLWAGRTELIFEQEDDEPNSIGLTFDTATGDVEIPLKSGRFEFLGR